MKRLVILFFGVVMLCSCTDGNKYSNGNIDVYNAEAFGHEYVVFENIKSGSIAVVHSEDCECKNNK